MALSSSEVQAFVDNDGYVYFDQGTHTLTTRVVLDGSQRVMIKGHPKAVINWTGSSAHAPFTYIKDTSDPQKLTFSWLKCVSEISGSPIFKMDETDGAVYFLQMEHCDFTTVGAYCVDMNRSPYIITPTFRYMKTSGGGAIRLKAKTGGNDPYHATSQMEITGWHHTGSNRVGAAFNFRGTSGLRMTDTIDSGDPSLLAALRGVYEGPVSFKINSCRTPVVIQNHIADYDTDFTNAANCFLHEVRTDSGTGAGKHEFLRWINGTIRDSNISGNAPFRVMGGQTVSQHGMVVQFEDCEDLTSGDFDFGGKLWVRIKRDWVNPGNESATATLETLINTTNWYSGSMSDTIYTDTDRIPSGSNDGGSSYTTGLSLYDDWVAESDEYEDYL